MNDRRAGAVQFSSKLENLIHDFCGTLSGDINMMIMFTDDTLANK